MSFAVLGEKEAVVSGTNTNAAQPPRATPWRPPTRKALALLMLLLGGCETASSSACPVEVRYSAEVQRQAAAEIARLPPGSTLGVFMADYARLRAQTRACRL